MHNVVYSDLLSAGLPRLLWEVTSRYHANQNCLLFQKGVGPLGMGATGQTVGGRAVMHPAMHPRIVLMHPNPAGGRSLEKPQAQAFPNPKPGLSPGQALVKNNKGLAWLGLLGPGLAWLRASGPSLGIKVKIPSRGRVLVEVDDVMIPSAAAVLHLIPSGQSGKNRAGTYTLGELQHRGQAPGAGHFKMVISTSDLRYYDPKPLSQSDSVPNTLVAGDSSSILGSDKESDGLDDSQDDSEDEDTTDGHQDSDDVESQRLDMLRAHAEIENAQAPSQSARA
ncbi:hypothetical protein DFP72DRAFT_845528 [Ephemerocybe angulata]|uniref:Uncharacterized protein n=1 Tax=Ephemerocybe angulata TaxID=980116 RepID=A0A8H6I537_9AGAR|nr:hypothetical protein DFP72DRAFT_845528 [Tulosesus angulatus]